MFEKIKITKACELWFEEERKKWGLKTALYNLLWMYQRYPKDYHSGIKANKRQAGKQKASKAGRNGKAVGARGTQKSLRKPRERDQSPWFGG